MSTPRTARTRALVMFGVVLAVVVAGVVSERSGRADNVPYVPKSASEIVERLPARALSLDLERLRQVAGDAPKDPERAADYAERCVKEARVTGDPRLLGRAQAALAPWWAHEAAPPRIVFLRAVIKQSLHDFDGALRDLDTLVTITPNDAQIWLTRAVVLTVTGRYEDARKSCERVAAPLPGVVCVATLDSLSGKAKPAYARLLGAIDNSGSAERAWALSTLAEVAVRAGDGPAAERHFKAALDLDPEDRYTLGAYADFLLDAGRPSDVPALIGDRLADDGLLLRLAIAEKRSRAKDAAARQRALGERHAASLARGDVVHRREQARFELELSGNAARALEIALANFEVQKEPWDVRLVLESAAAAGKPGAASTAALFVEKTGTEEPILKTLAAAVKR